LNFKDKQKHYERLERRKARERNQNCYNGTGSALVDSMQTGSADDNERTVG